jgi:predicted AAA+ superfamily ATPase
MTTLLRLIFLLEMDFYNANEMGPRIKAAYPIHPEIFDRLYTDWSTLVKFQRTRGVLRLMAAVIHSL